MRKKQYSKELILNTAIELSKEVGFKKLTVRELANRVGCSIMPIYSTFDSKELLIEEVFNYVVRELLSINNYFKRNIVVLSQGVRSPEFHRDMSSFIPDDNTFEVLYKDTLNLMKKEPLLNGFTDEQLSRIHFDISLYITGIVERKLYKRQQFDDYLQFCIDTLDKFTSTIVKGYQK